MSFQDFLADGQDKLMEILFKMNEYVVEYVDDYGCDEVKAGFQIHFYPLPMIY